MFRKTFKFLILIVHPRPVRRYVANSETGTDKINGPQKKSHLIYRRLIQTHYTCSPGPDGDLPVSVRVLANLRFLMWKPPKGATPSAVLPSSTRSRRVAGHHVIVCNAVEISPPTPSFVELNPWRTLIRRETRLRLRLLLNFTRHRCLRRCGNFVRSLALFGGLLDAFLIGSVSQPASGRGTYPPLHPVVRSSAARHVFFKMSIAVK